MDAPLSYNQELHKTASEASTPELLLERGIQCTLQGCYVEGVALFERAREQFAHNQVQFAAVVDTFIQSHSRYLQAQQALHMASKHLVEVDIELQTRLFALEKVLSTLREKKDRTLQTDVPDRPPESLRGQELQQVSLPSFIDSHGEQQSPLSKSGSADGDTLPALSVNCFGRFEVKRLDQSIALCTNRSGQAILRYLIAQSGYSASKDTLMGVLWPEDTSEVARRKLQIAVSAMRLSLNNGYPCDPGEGYILYKDQFYLLNPSVQIRTDVDEFLSLWQAGRQSSGSKAAVLYERACDLYTGPFLVEDLYADWSFIRREQLGQIYLNMCHILANHYFAAVCYEDATKWIEEILKKNRCDEEAHRQLIRVYAATGRRSEALRQYRLCERLLASDLGVQPMPETVSLFHTILMCEPFPAEETKIERK